MGRGRLVHDPNAVPYVRSDLDPTVATATEQDEVPQASTLRPRGIKVVGPTGCAPCHDAEEPEQPEGHYDVKMRGGNWTPKTIVSGAVDD